MAAKTATKSTKTATAAPTAVAGKTPADRLADAAKDVLYISVGASVLAFQRAQVQRVELAKAMELRLTEGRKQLADLTKAAGTTAEGRLAQLDDRMAAVEARVDDALEMVQSRLPKPAAELLGQARTAAKTTRTQVRELLNVG